MRRRVVRLSRSRNAHILREAFHEPRCCGRVVDKTDDPESLGRVRVRIRIIADFVRWARVVRPAAQADFLAPTGGDDVLIAFEGGSLDQPFVPLFR
jgi:hypothetical protein